MAIQIRLDEKTCIEIQKQYDQQLHAYLNGFNNEAKREDVSKEDLIEFIETQLDELKQRIAIAEVKLML